MSRTRRHLIELVAAALAGVLWGAYLTPAAAEPIPAGLLRYVERIAVALERANTLTERGCRK